jgi:hypothetical protein
MKLLGILFALAGWMLPVLSLGWTSSTGARLLFCLVGMMLCAIGILKFINGAHLKQAIWKR